MQETVTIILPVSRKRYLSTVFNSLEMLECDRKRTNLLVIVDGDDDLFVEARNYTAGSKFNETLTIPYSKRDTPALSDRDILGRRLRISDIHNELKGYVKDCKYVLGVEDDTVIPPLTLQFLLEDFLEYPNAGFIQGTEIGRYDKPYVGGWNADDVYEPKDIKSIMPPEDPTEKLTSLDAGGLYCFLARKEIYTAHQFKPFQGNGMGPDADFGIALRQLGYSNFIDWRIRCVHMNGEEKLSLATNKPVQVGFRKHPGRKVWQFYSK